MTAHVTLGAWSPLATTVFACPHAQWAQANASGEGTIALPCETTHDPPRDKHPRTKGCHAPAATVSALRGAHARARRAALRRVGGIAPLARSASGRGPLRARRLRGAVALVVAARSHPCAASRSEGRALGAGLAAAQSVASLSTVPSQSQQPSRQLQSDSPAQGYGERLPLRIRMACLQPAAASNVRSQPDARVPAHRGPLASHRQDAALRSPPARCGRPLTRGDLAGACRERRADPLVRDGRVERERAAVPLLLHLSGTDARGPSLLHRASLGRCAARARGDRRVERLVRPALSLQQPPPCASSFAHDALV